MTRIEPFDSDALTDNLDVFLVGNFIGVKYNGIPILHGVDNANATATGHEAAVDEVDSGVIVAAEGGLHIDVDQLAGWASSGGLELLSRRSATDIGRRGTFSGTLVHCRYLV